MIHGYSRAMFFQTASQRIKQMAWYTISPKLAESLMAMAPCSLALILFSRSLLAGVTLNKHKTSSPTAFQPTSSVIGIWILATWRKTYFAGKDRITYPLHSPALLSGWILPNFPNMDQWNDVSSCLMFFHFSSPDAVDVGHVDSVVVQPSGELEALEWMRGAIEWMLRYVKIHRSSTSTWNQFHLKSILDLTWFCTLLQRVELLIIWVFCDMIVIYKSFTICCVFAFEPGGCLPAGAGDDEKTSPNLASSTSVVPQRGEHWLPSAERFARRACVSFGDDRRVTVGWHGDHGLMFSVGW